MEKVAPTQQQQQQQQQQLQNPQGLYKCPRCDSSNTKFCYYNNYSLSQPRHFCKACKRYWTRGGTLRNVPVGGGCRKNKRVKRPADASLEVPNTTTGNNVTTTSSANPRYSNIIPSASNHINPLFYGLSSNSSELNLPFPTRFNPSSRVSSISIDGFNLQPQLNAPGLGFSSGLVMSSSRGSDVENSGFIDPNKRIQDVVATSTTIPTNTIPLLPSYSSIFGSSSSSPSPTMATLLASSFLQQKVSVKANNNTSTSTPLEGLQMNGNNESGDVLKGVKVEPTGKSGLNWNLSYQNELEQVGFADPNSLYWNNNSSVVGSWDDSSNIGPSVTSLI